MHWLKFVYYGVMVLALVASFRGFRYREYVLFIPLLALSLAVEVAREFLKGQPEITKYFNLYIAAEYALLALIISKFIYSRNKRLIILGSIFVLVPLFVFIRFVLVPKNPSYQFLDLMIESPFLCAWTILYLFETVKQEEEFEVAKNPMFWISLGNLLFFSGSFFSYGFGSYLASKGNAHMADIIFWIARILNILLYIFYFIGFLCVRKKMSYSSP
jgi:hypothetical protein